MRFLLIIICLMASLWHQAFCQFTVTAVGQLPEKVSNNALCEGVVNGRPYLFSFGGIDETLQHTGIHKKCFGYDILEDTSFTLPDLPDTLGKIASAANRIGNIIYISGGYHVFSSGGEKSSSRMHRFDIVSRNFISDAADIPVPIDDHVQAVWRDSLIYIVTGWSETTNVSNVQIFNPISNQWLSGTSIPNQNNYKSFGSSGTIIGDTIYYFGGASSGSGFPIQNQLRTGIINPNDPTDISWSFQVPDPMTTGYRMACTQVNGKAHWIGGSLNTYNNNGLAYDGSGDSPLSNRDLFYVESVSLWSKTFVNEIPMDLRGVANINDSVVYLAGGMLSGREVTDNVYRLQWNGVPTGIEEISERQLLWSLYPNPSNGLINLLFKSFENVPKRIVVYNMQGQLMDEKISRLASATLDIHHFNPGVYVIGVTTPQSTTYQQLIISDR